MHKTNIYRTVRDAFPAFRDRADAGRVLAGYVGPDPNPDAVVLALPRGGVPVADPLAERLGAPLEPVLVRKLPIPGNPEMGFGAVAIDGTRILNDPIVSHFRISTDAVERITTEVLDEVRRRSREYVGDDSPPRVEGKDVYMIDDGLATGFSMIVAVSMVRNLGPRSLILAVPVSPIRSLESTSPHFHHTYCLYGQSEGPFAVASFYQYFPDLTDEQVRAVLETRRVKQP